MTIQEMVQAARKLSIEERKQLIKGLIDIVDAPVIEAPKKPDVSQYSDLAAHPSDEEDS